MNKVLKSAIVTQIALGAYLQVVEWIPLGRWNNVSNGNGQKSTDLTLVVLQATILVFYWRRWRWPMLAGLGLYGFWLYVEVSSWWVPYFRGASSQFMRFYEHWFGNTYKFLPPIDGHPIPDAEHTVILGLLLLVLTVSTIAVCNAFRTHSMRQLRSD
ncbi:MAG TPA: hypothetical protein VN875_20990 [Candidatus Binatus sp.]|jgi:hypothetical protein|nr:hypothetical protein [Candidatus Binatus sp.]